MTVLEEKKVKPRTLHPERVTLTPEAAARIDGWHEQIAPRLSGKKLCRADLVNWLVSQHEDELSEAEQNSLYEVHYDPIRSLEWAVRKAKEAQANGEAIRIKDFVDDFLAPKSSFENRKTKRVKSKKDLMDDPTIFPTFQQERTEL